MTNLHACRLRRIVNRHRSTENKIIGPTHVNLLCAQYNQYFSKVRWIPLHMLKGLKKASEHEKMNLRYTFYT